MLDFRLDLVSHFCNDRRPSLRHCRYVPPLIRPLVFAGGVIYDVKRVVEIGLLHTNGDPAEYKRALCANENLLAKTSRSKFYLGAGASWAPSRLYVGRNARRSGNDRDLAFGDDTSSNFPLKSEWAKGGDGQFTWRDRASARRGDQHQSGNLRGLPDFWRGNRTVDARSL